MVPLSARLNNYFNVPVSNRMEIFPVLLLLTIGLLILVVTAEVYAPSLTLEGFKTLTKPTSYWAGVARMRTHFQVIL